MFCVRLRCCKDHFGLQLLRKCLELYEKLRRCEDGRFLLQYRGGEGLGVPLLS